MIYYYKFSFLILIVPIILGLHGCVPDAPQTRTITTYTIRTYQIDNEFVQLEKNRYYTKVHNSVAPNFQPIPIKKLYNYKSLKKKQTDAEFQQAYDIALQIVLPLSGLPLEQQIIGIAQKLRVHYDAGGKYSMSEPHYNDPYGFFVRTIASCAGCTRATGLCLNILGIHYQHINENKWKHQWCRINVNGKYWICDAFAYYAGEEYEPCKHPIFKYGPEK